MPRQSEDGKKTAPATERIPGGWRELPFSDAVEINPRRVVARGTLAPFVDMASLPAETRDIRPGRVKPVAPGGSRFANGDTLFARITPCTENGKTGLVDCLSTGEVATGSTEFIVLGPRPDLTLPEYVYYLAKNPAFRSYAISRMMGTSGRQRVPTSVFDDFEVRIPPVPEQNKIAAILSAVDDAIENTQAVIEQLMIVKRGLVQDLFVQGLPGRHSLFKKTRDGEIPNDWRLMNLGDVVDVHLSSVDKKTRIGEQKVWLCNYTDVYHHHVIRSDMVFMEATATEREIHNCQLEVGDVVITKDSETPDDIGVPAVVRDKFHNLICGYHLAILRPAKSILDGEYLGFALNQERARKQFRTYANGITRFGLRKRDIQRVRIPLPSISEQRRIAAVVASVNDVIEKHQSAMDRIRVCKGALMSVLLTGEVRVTPNKEAA